MIFSEKVTSDSRLADAFVSNTYSTPPSASFCSRSPISSGVPISAASSLAMPASAKVAGARLSGFFASSPIFFSVSMRRA